MTFPVAILIICITTIGFLLITDARAAARKSRSLDELLYGPGRFFIWQSRQITMILLFLIAINSGITQSQFYLPGWQPDLAVYILFCGITVMAGFNGAKRKTAAFDFSFCRDQQKTVNYISYFITRILYLVLYEFVFRGLFLYACLVLMDVKLAIAINIGIYSIAHWYSNRQEIIGVLPFGLILCLLTLWYESVWPAIGLHLCLALSHDLTLIMIKEKTTASSLTTSFNQKT
jgi:membrane protease YdiL (CAAX protease family)